MKKVLIIGSGKSGLAAAELLKDKAECFIWDDKMPAEKKPSVSSFDELILSPGVSINHPMSKEAQSLGIKVSGELELAYENCSSRFVAITGTNGKTTTTTLVGEICRAYFDDVRVVGNIGTPVSAELGGTDENTVMVTEVSSFQLETASEFKPVVSAILNITPDHLDRHGTFECYADTKARIAANQTADDYFIYNLEDELCVRYAEALNKKENGPKTVPFSSKKKLPFEIPVIQIPGDHNMQNALAAAAICISLGIPKDLILKTIAEFKGVEHRMEFVKEIGGVRYINDSKGTNPDSTIKAVEATDTPILIIAGGYEKNSDFTELISMMKPKVRYILAMGATGPRFAKRAKELGFSDEAVIECANLDECVAKAHELAKSGDTVLLSPASASWDMYGHFEERGEHFKRLVNEIDG